MDKNIYIKVVFDQTCQLIEIHNKVVESQCRQINYVYAMIAKYVETVDEHEKLNAWRNAIIDGGKYLIKECREQLELHDRQEVLYEHQIDLLCKSMLKLLDNNDLIC